MSKNKPTLGERMNVIENALETIATRLTVGGNGASAFPATGVAEPATIEPADGPTYTPDGVDTFGRPTFGSMPLTKKGFPQYCSGDFLCFRAYSIAHAPEVVIGKEKANHSQAKRGKTFANHCEDCRLNGADRYAKRAAQWLKNAKAS
jgi:hypothetical protein